MLQPDYPEKEAWAFAKEKLKTTPAGTEIHPRHIQKLPSTDAPLIEIKHKFIKGNNDTVYAIFPGTPIGKGSFGTVRLAADESERLWAIKESPLALKAETEEESFIATDTQHALPAISLKEKYIQFYHYAGQTLAEYLNTTTLNRTQQVNLSIKTCHAVYQLHAGVLSSTHQNYAHLDINPANLCIDRAGAVHLIDFGFSQKLEGKMLKKQGTPLYLPNISSLSAINKEALDVFALLRMLYLPHDFLSYGGGRDTRLRDDVCIFSNASLTQAPQLKTRLDTTDGKVKSGSVRELLYELVFCKHGLKYKPEYQRILDTDSESLNGSFDDNMQCTLIFNFILNRFKRTEQSDHASHCKDPRVMIAQFQRLQQLHLDDAAHIRTLVPPTANSAGEQEHMTRLKQLHQAIVGVIEKGSLPTHGLLGGTRIPFQGKVKRVPHGVSLICNLIINEQGEPKQLDVSILKEIQTIAQKRHQPAPRSTWFGFFAKRDSETCDFYKGISTLVTEAISMMPPPTPTDGESHLVSP